MVYIEDFVIDIWNQAALLGSRYQWQNRLSKEQNNNITLFVIVKKL